MRLWRKTLGLLKDRNSIWISKSFSSRNGLRNPDIEAAVILATSHHECFLDHANVERVCQLVRLSPFHLKPFLWSISNRMDNTRSWVVALKGLHLMHVFINSNIPFINKMGRLPFDLSNFKDGHSSKAKSWPFDDFIRAYYNFLDQKSTLIFKYYTEENLSVLEELILLRKLQSLIDLLIQIKPLGRAASLPLVLQVMDGVIVEVYNMYNRIYRGINEVVLMNNDNTFSKEETIMTLNVAHEAVFHSEQLTLYLSFCREIGVAKASGISVVDRIPELRIKNLEEMVLNGMFSDDKLAIVVMDDNKEKDDRATRTIITNKWEKFDEDSLFASPLPTRENKNLQQDLPDLISF